MSAIDQPKTSLYPGDSHRSRRTADLLTQASTTSDDDVRNTALHEVVVLNRGIADAVASRYFRRGVSDEDLCQTAYEGLVKAAHRFKPDLGYDFLAFAVPTVRGEVRRYFRNHGWVVRPPRRLQDLQWSLHRATDQLFQELGREPTTAELADALDVSPSDLDEARRAYGSFAPVSLDAPRAQASDTVGALVAAEEGQFTQVEARLALLPLLQRLCERDQRIVFLRFCEDRTQAEIGAELGVTQMQVSRLLTRILRTLRAGLEEKGVDGVDRVHAVGSPDSHASPDRPDDFPAIPA